jgi:glycine dehydrogenase subunit 1
MRKKTNRSRERFAKHEGGVAMGYIPNTQAVCQEMLREIGVESVEDLFSDIPEAVALHRPLAIPGPLSEMDLLEHFKRMSEENTHGDRAAYFLGAGAYLHWVPSVVSHLAGRAEFYTAYTPYQPEVSQGTLQAIFEFQTYITLLTGMEVANASIYDGASALAEAVLMAMRIRSGREDVLIPSTLHPEYREVVKTYLLAQDARIRDVPSTSDFQTDWAAVEAMISEETCCLVVQNPNFFGTIEDLAALRRISEKVHEVGGLIIATVIEPISLGILTPPGEYGADIVVGEGQSLGNPVSFGGPFLGIFATKKAYVRKMPGRIVGQTADSRGERGYVLTLATREQHIRREKATSNICTNQSLCALRASIYLSVLGKRGFREMALINLRNAHYAKEKLGRLKEFKVQKVPVFNEFVVKSSRPVSEIREALMDHDIVGGLDLAQFFPDLKDHMLFCVTERNNHKEIDRMCDILRGLA